MTAEVALLNRECVALAADSAVTIGGGSAQKIFPSAQKLFPLSLRYPVGLMMYNNATLVGVPWESMTKTYRSERGNRKFDTLREHAADFLEFVCGDKRLFPEQQQLQYFLWTVGDLFSRLRREVDEDLGEVPEAYGHGRDAALGAAVQRVVARAAERFTQAPVTASMSTVGLEKRLRKTYAPHIEELKRRIFAGLPLSAAASDQLEEIAAGLFLRDAGQEFPEWTGLVIAGFGHADFLPSLQHYVFEGVVANSVRFHEREFAAIDFNHPAHIVPFAQSDGVRTFLDGVDPRYGREIDERLEEVLSVYPARLLAELGELDPHQRQAIENRADELAQAISREQHEKLAEFRHTELNIPVLNVVSALPKDELAEMAEALVNLTSFKRRISMDPETVGGPIDVAVISKGDGFVWIKRKDYYEPALNPFVPRAELEEALALLRTMGATGP